MYSKEQLIEMSKVYFNNTPTLLHMFATSDGNFFYPQNRNDAKYHSDSKGLEMFEIRKHETLAKVLEEISTQPKVNKPKK